MVCLMKDASILAVGGCGGMGQAATKLIAENYGAGRLTIADFNLEAAQSWAEGLQKGFVDSIFIDLNKAESLGPLFQDYDLVLNLAPYRFNLPIMVGCLKGDCHYVDLGGLFHVTKEQLALDPKFTHLGKTAVLGIGASPGMANIAGEVMGFYSIHSELATFPYRYTGIQEVSFRVAFSAAMVQAIKALVNYGLTSREPLDLGGGQSISRWDFILKHFETFPRASGLSEMKSVRVTTLGVKGGVDQAVQHEVVVDSRPDWELTATAVWTGFPAAVAAKLVLEGKARIGAHDPESLFEPEDILPELAAVGCAIVPSSEGDVIRHK